MKIGTSKKNIVFHIQKYKNDGHYILNKRPIVFKILQLCKLHLQKSKHFRFIGSLELQIEI